MHSDTKHIKLTNELRNMIGDVDNLRKDYSELNQKYHQTIMLLNLVMRQVKEIDIDILDLFKYNDLSIDCVMMTNHRDKPNKLYYDFSKLKSE